ncbi:MAG: hypothetical protein ACK559_20015 [bacterium]
MAAREQLAAGAHPQRQRWERRPAGPRPLGLRSRTGGLFEAGFEVLLGHSSHLRRAIVDRSGR